MLTNEQGEANSAGDWSEPLGPWVWRDETHPQAQKTVGWLRAPAPPSVPKTTPACKTTHSSMSCSLQMLWFFHITHLLQHMWGGTNSKGQRKDLKTMENQCFKLRKEVLKVECLNTFGHRRLYIKTAHTKLALWCSSPWIASSANPVFNFKGHLPSN